MIAFIIKDYLLNSFSQLVPIALSVIAILISIVGLYLSNRANKKSSRIQELQTRPWLNATINRVCWKTWHLLSINILSLFLC